MPSGESPRIRRLRSDLRALQALRENSTIFDFVAYGNPPERFEITFLGPGLRLSDDQSRVELQMVHRAEIRLGVNYPRAMPELAWRTPVFHPNISAIGMVCLGGYGQFWVPSLQLDELCTMLWDMIRFANYDVASPYNRSSADWTRTQTQFSFPLDKRGLRDKAGRAGEAAAAAKPAQGVIVLAEAPKPEEDVIFLEEAPPRPNARPADPGILFVE